MNLIEASIETKVDKRTMKLKLEDKLDSNLFYRAFPRLQAPIDFMKGLIKE